MKRDIKYIIKRILIGVGIVLVMSFINSCDVHASTYSLSTDSLKARYYPSGNWSTINWNSWNYSPSNNSLYGLEMNFEPGYSDNYTFNPIGAGTYLFDFYIRTDDFSSRSSNCNGLTSDFQFQDTTTGNWVSARSSSSSSCIDSYYTNISGSRAIHYLIQWQITNTQSYNYNVSKARFIIYNNNSTGFTDTNKEYYLIMGSLQDYDSQIVSDFKKLANDNNNTQSIINNQNSNTQSIINNQNQNQTQNHQDSINEQNAINGVNDSINDSSIPSDSESKINSITDKIKENQNTSIVQIATFFPQMLQLIINGMNTSCTGGYSLGSLYGTELTIPCINPVDYLGSFLWGVIDSILCLCYLIPLCKFLVNKYNDLTSMKNLRWQ